MSLPPENPAWFQSILACPACLAQCWNPPQDSKDPESGLECGRCNRLYSVSPHGVPILFPADVVLGVPEPHLGMWALSQTRSLKEYRERSLASTAMQDRPGTVEFTRFIEDADGQIVLDVGAGTDYVPWYLEARHFSRYVALDPLPAERSVPFHRVQAWAELLPFADQVFDAIILGTSLDHFLCPDSFWLEARRVLKPGGCVYNWGGLFPESTWLKQMPGSPLFPRPLPALPDLQDRQAQQQVRQTLDCMLTDVGTLEQTYSKHLIDPFHFRHMTFDFFFGLERLGFGLAAVELFKLRYHFGSVYAHAFLKMGMQESLSRGVQQEMRWRLQSLRVAAELHQKVFDLGERSGKAVEHLEMKIASLNDSFCSLQDGVRRQNEILSYWSSDRIVEHESDVRKALSQVSSLEDQTRKLLQASLNLDQRMKDFLAKSVGDREFLQASLNLDQRMKDFLAHSVGDRELLQVQDRKIDQAQTRLHTMEALLISLCEQGKLLQDHLEQFERGFDQQMQKLSLSWFDNLMNRFKDWWKQIQGKAEP